MEEILDIIQAMNDLKVVPYNNTIQKMMYLIQEQEEYKKNSSKVVFDYSIYYYGPYSDDLDAIIRYHNSSGDIEIKEGDKDMHELHLVENRDIDKNLTNLLKPTVEAFSNKPLRDLELLTTTLYLRKYLPNKDLIEFSEGVVRFSGNTHDINEVDKVLKELNSFGYKV